MRVDFSRVDPRQFVKARLEGRGEERIIAVLSLSLWSICDALLDALRRGMNVSMVMESDNMDSDEVRELIAADIPILGDRREGLMHDKFVVIDRQEVWTGSQVGNGSLRTPIIVALADKVHIIDCALATGIELGGEVFPIQWQASAERAREGYRETTRPSVIAGQGEFPQVFVIH